MIPADGQIVLIFCGKVLYSIARYSRNAPVLWLSLASMEEVRPTHWMPLPEPPKRQSSFDAYYRFVPLGDSTRTFAKQIWDAAIAASKSPDFVP